jgi:DNA replication licensing factor MCM6
VGPPGCDTAWCYAKVVVQITPQIVREAYSLLRQSIIHVEQDDINFEDEDGEAANGINGDDDDAMDAAYSAALDSAESSYNAQRTSSGAANGTVIAGTSSGQPAAATAPGKKKTRITCKSDQGMQIVFDADSA